MNENALFGDFSSYKYIFKDERQLYGYATLLICLFINYHFFFNVVRWFDLLSFGYPPTSALMPADPHVFWRFSLYGNLTGLAFNVLGPTLLLKIFQSNLYLVFLFNMSLIGYSVFAFSQTLNRSFYFAFTVLFLNPVILAQVFYPNKELYMLICSMFFLAYQGLKERKFLVLGCFLMLFTKLEYVTISMLWLVLCRFNRGIWLLVVLVLLISISFLYNYIPGINQKLTVLKAYQQYGEIGLTAYMQKISSEYYLFILTIPPKVLNALIGQFIDFVKAPQDFWVGFPMIISSLVMTALVTIALFKIIRQKIGHEHLFIVLWFIAVATVPFSLHRYLFPCYPFLYSVVFKKVVT